MIGYQAGFNVATVPQVEPAFRAANKAAIKQCVSDGESEKTCNDLRTTSITEVSCKDLAPQNGGVNRCGYWQISFVNWVAPDVMISYDVSVKYSAEVFKVEYNGTKTLSTDQ